VSIILAAMNASLDANLGWSLFFEDDAQLNKNCQNYCLPQPVPDVCEYVTLDNRAHYVYRKDLGNGYSQSLATNGHGTAGFWFSRQFAIHMLRQAAKGGLQKPPDVFIFESARKHGICFLTGDCTVDHDDTPSLRVQHFHKNILTPC